MHLNGLESIFGRYHKSVNFTAKKFQWTNVNDFDIGVWFWLDTTEATQRYTKALHLLIHDWIKYTTGQVALSIKLTHYYFIQVWLMQTFTKYEERVIKSCPS